MGALGSGERVRVVWGGRQGGEGGEGGYIPFFFFSTPRPLALDALDDLGIVALDALVLALVALERLAGMLTAVGNAKRG